MKFKQSDNWLYCLYNFIDDKAVYHEKTKEKKLY
jgi:hypothetical protein